MNKIRKSIFYYIRVGFWKGVGWSFGVTFGFVIISTLIIFVLSKLGGLPVVGGFIADLVEATQESLLRRGKF